MRARQALAGAMLALLAGCASPAPVAAPPPAPMPAPAARLPELPASRLEQELAVTTPRRVYTLGVRDADIREVLLAFARQTDLSVVFGPEVAGTVTMDIKRVTLEEAFDALLSPIGLEWRREGSLLRVFKPEPETRVLTLSYPATVRLGSSALSATTGGPAAGVAVSPGGTIITGGVAAAGGPTAAGGVAAGGGGAGTIASTDTVDLWADVEKGLKSLLSPNGTITVNKTAGILAVTDFPRNLSRIAKYLELLEGSVQRQVMIEAHVVEVQLSDQFELGINWSLLPAIEDLGGLRGTLGGGAGVVQTTARPNAPFQIGLAIPTVSVLLSALAQQGEVNVLSRPRISTLNNQKAVIKVAVDDVFFVTLRTEDPVTGRVRETQTPQTVTEGVVLDVTPQIGDDGVITMNIRPSITERVGTARSRLGDEVPIIAVRATDTVARVPDGQTVVIAGLIQDRATRTLSGTPGAKDLPVLGWLFRRTEKERRKSELVVFLTPHLLIGRRQAELSPRELELLRQGETLAPVRRR